MKTHNFLSIILVSCFFFSATAQQQIAPLPIDPKVRYGKLDNGMTYYIRHNETPKQQADFYIAQNVGSILEKDSQSGLAHFLEHMAFNGSKNFPGKSIISYMETIGVKFGENLNAYTSYDKTVYNISNVPVSRQGIIDTCLLVLHDWSGFLSLEDKAIDGERKVIHEEWRSRRTPSFRIMEKELENVFAGSQYANRFVIGSMDVVDNFKYQELRDYYHKWYRPDLQAIIIVGDIDVDAVEKQIKVMYADIPKPVNPAERIYYKVPQNKEPIFSLVTDKEETNTSVKLFFKHDPLSKEAKSTSMGMVQSYMRMAFGIMMSGRFQEIVQNSNAPFMRAYAYDNQFFIAATEDALTFSTMVRDGGVKTGYSALLDEIARVKQYGFTATEYERAKTSILKVYERLYNEREKRKNGEYSEEYANHFTSGGTISGIEIEYQVMQQIANALSVGQINQWIEKLIKKEDIVISVTGPEKENIVYPSKEEMVKMFEDSFDKKMEAYKDEVITEPLMTKLPKAGTIKKETKDAVYGTTEWLLSNGAKVVFKPTTFKKDEIKLAFVRKGGYSQLPKVDPVNYKMLSDIAGLGGVSKYSLLDLKKMLAGKTVTVSLNVALSEEGGSGSTTVQDLETMLQLLYLSFTDPRMDSTAYASQMSRTKIALERAALDPMTDFRDSVTKVLYNNNPIFKRVEANDLNKINYPQIIQMFKSRYDNAAGFTFVFAGNIDLEKIKPLILQYIGGLPGTTYKEPKVTADAGVRKTSYKSSFEKTLETSKATVFDAYAADLQYTTENIVKMAILNDILKIVYTDKVRTAEGGTYGVAVSSGISKYPVGQTLLQITFETSPEKRDYLNNIIHKELKAFTENGPSAENFNKVTEFLLKKYKEDLQENTYWSRSLRDYYVYNSDMIDTYEKVVKAQTPETIRQFAKMFVDKAHVLEVLFSGVAKE